MAVVSSRGKSEQLQLQRKWKDNNPNPNPNPNPSNVVWSQPSPKLINTDIIVDTRRVVVVPVVYYLSRNGLLDHPHFIEVPLSSPPALFLRDVINRLNLLRGKAIASQYSWSSKRSYKNGYVWHDLEENDFIHPVHGGEYVLKGSEILLETVSKSPETTSSSSSSTAKTTKPAGDSEYPRNRRRNQSWGAMELSEYKVYKSESTHEFAQKAAADASTQTDDKRRRIRRETKTETIKEEKRNEIVEEVEQQQSTTELSREEISPPPSDSSPETLESLMKADGRLILVTSSSSQPTNQAANPTAGNCPSGRIKASSVLMSLISCGSTSFRDHGFSLISHYKTRLPRGGNQTVGENQKVEGMNRMMIEMENNVSSSFAKMALEEKEYFSGSLIETKKQEFPSLQRSSSYNADRSSHLKLEEKEGEGVRAKCIPRKPKGQPSSKIEE